MSLTSNDSEETIYGAPSHMTRSRRQTSAAATAQGDKTMYSAPAPSQNKAPRPTAPAAATSHVGTIYGGPGTKTAEVPTQEGTVYGGPGAVPTPPPTQGDTEYGPPGNNTPHAPQSAPQTPGADTDQPLPLGSRIGKHKEYTIEKYLGKGGFGHTYLVSNGIVTHVVKECAPLHFSQRDANGAIHPIPGCEDDFNKLREDFSNEIDTLNAARGKDTRIVHLVDKFDDNHTKYYVMAHLPGGSLHNLRSETKKAFNEDELKKVLDDLLGALEALHAADIIHRDIKPQNIMLTESGDSVLIDFGSACFMWKKAKAIRAASPHWAPPEEFAADYTVKIGPHTDLYELGATIYYLITGKEFHHPDLVSKLKDIYSAAHKMTIDKVQELVAPYLLRPCTEIMEMKAYSIGFRKALCKALEPDISKRLASVKEWKELISKEKLNEEELREIDETIKTHPERINAAMIKKLQQLKASGQSAELSLAKCYKHLWRKAEKEQMPKDAKKNLGLYETYLKEARESRIKGAFREAANHLLRQNCGTMDEASLEQAAAWYEEDKLPQQAQNCKTALGVMRTYKRLARTRGFTGAHNRYLQEKHLAKECALLPQEGAQNIHPQLRGIAQLLCLLLSGGLCLPFIWLMALVEYKKISHYISPIHLTELND